MNPVAMDLGNLRVSDAGPFSGQWLDNEGTIITIEGGKVHGPDRVFDLNIESDNVCSLTVFGIPVKGTLTAGHSGPQLTWSDGDVWTGVRECGVAAKSTEPCQEETPAARDAGSARPGKREVDQAHSTPGIAAPLAAGRRVRLAGLKANPERNGLTGTLVAQVDDHRWQVRLDGVGRWVAKAAHLEGLSLQVIQPGCDALSIAGTWSNWSVQSMTWDVESCCYYYEVRLGSSAQESFQILVRGDWTARLYPDRGDSCPHEGHNLCGPDDAGQGQNWTIGQHPLDRGCKGAWYKVRLFLTEGGQPRAIDWVRLSTQLDKHDSVCIVGTWDNWRSHKMLRDSVQSPYSFEVQLGENGWESFQILVDGDWEKCLHPDRPDGTHHTEHILCGPDNSGHGKNWTIGRHPLDRGAKGMVYSIRLHTTANDLLKGVDWCLLEPKVPTDTAAAVATAAPAAAGSPGPLGPSRQQL